MGWSRSDAKYLDKGMLRDPTVKSVGAGRFWLCTGRTYDGALYTFGALAEGVRRNSDAYGGIDVQEEASTEPVVIVIGRYGAERIERK